MDRATMAKVSLDGIRVMGAELQEQRITLHGCRVKREARAGGADPSHHVQLPNGVDERAEELDTTHNVPRLSRRAPSALMAATRSATRLSSWAYGR